MQNLSCESKFSQEHSYRCKGALFKSFLCPLNNNNNCESFEPRSHFKSRLSLIVRLNLVLNRTVVVDGD